MLSQRQIDRLARGGRHRQLIRLILSNGRCASRAARTRLCEPVNCVPAALGLALQRLAELSYSRTDATDHLARLLVELQQPDGGFGEAIPNNRVAPTRSAEEREADDPRPDGGPAAVSPLAGTAAAVRGLLDWQALHLASPLSDVGSDEDDLALAVGHAIARGLSHLAARQRDDDLLGDGLADTAIVLWQLGEASPFRATVRWRPMIDALRAIAAGRSSRDRDLARAAYAAAA